MTDAAVAPFACVAAAWRSHEPEVRQFLRKRLPDPHSADDLLQDVFVKAMRAGHGFCALENPRAWLFQVARTTLIDHYRTGRPTEPLPESDELLAAPPAEGPEPVDALAGCVDRALGCLAPEDARVLRACDLEGLAQKDYAAAQGLSLPAAKARLRRARQRLREELTAACSVQFDSSGRVSDHAGLPPAV